MCQFEFIADTLRDCRKSPKVVILAISHVMKSNGYGHQNHKFRVFRQSLQKGQISNESKMMGY